MTLMSDLFSKFVGIYFISTCMISVYGRYTQSEIDEAYKKMTKRQTLYHPVDNQIGCWPNNSIPFTLDPDFTQDQVQHIYKDIYQIQNRTCIRWVEVKNVGDWLKKYVKFGYTEDTGISSIACYTKEYKEFASPYNRNKIVATQILLTDICFRKKAVIHEILHALGQEHEHQRIDRDCYVDVDDDHAKNDPEFKVIYDYKAFEKWPYDKRSILHYVRIPGHIRDNNEPWPGWLWRYSLGDQNESGVLTGMDVYKLNYRFCKAADYCKINNDECVKIEEEENRKGCKKLFIDIARGIVTPTKQ